MGKPLLDLTSQVEYIYDGYTFSSNVERTAQQKNIEIIRRIGKAKPQGAIFKLTKGGKKYGVIYYSTSVTAGSNINAGKIGMQYSGRKGATENLGIQADKLIRGGKFEKRILNGQEVQCAVFTNTRDLANSILSAFKANPNVGNHIYDAVDDLLKSTSMNKIIWDESFRDSDIAELGKYFGELLIGAIALSKKGGTTLQPNIFASKQIKEFIVPDDPSFSGVDSALVTADGEIIPISSKAGEGAKASIFTNLLPKLLASQKPLPNSVIKDVVEASKRAGVTKEQLLAKRRSKDVVYEYGLRDILKIPKSDVPNALDVFTALKKGDMNARGVQQVIQKIQESPEIAQNVKDMLPKSVTAAFTRTIANRLNADDRSVKLMISVLAGKNFWQANLKLPKWKRGEIEFTLLQSGEAKIDIIGSKAAIGDLDASQGLVNYKLS